MRSRTFVLVAAGFELGLLALAWGLGRLLATPVGGRLHLEGAALGWGVLAAVPLFFGLLGLRRSDWAPLARLHALVDELVDRLFVRCSVLELAAVSILAGIGEEALFRGVVQSAIASAAGPAAGLLAASLLFGAAHYLSTTYAVVATAIGLVLGGLFLAFDNLLVPITTHAAFDFFALVYLVRRRVRPAAR